MPRRPIAEVAGETLTVVPVLAAHFETTQEALLEGVPHLRERPRYLPWSDFVQMMDNVARRVDYDDERLEALGRLVHESRDIAWVSWAVGLVLEPAPFLVRVTQFALRRLFPVMRVSVRRGRDLVRVELALPPAAPPSRAHFAMLAGSIASVTTSVGLPPSEVLWESDGHAATYRIFPPPSRSIWARLQQTGRSLMYGRSTYDELRRHQVELLRRNEALRSALEDREAALAVRDRFLQTMGHELRTPVNGVLHSARTLRSPNEDDETSDLLTTLEASAERLSSVLNAVLSYAKLTAGDIAPSPTDRRPSDLVRVLVQGIAAGARHRRVALTTSLGEGATDWWRLDMEHVWRIGHELLRNAVAYSPPGQTVECAAWVQDRRLTLEVRDRGPGIPLELTEAVFEPFFQHNTTEARASGGNGLGLSIARVTARALGGDVNLHPRAEGGTVAAVTLPVEPGQPPDAPRATDRRVLVVDDDAVSRLVAVRLLQDMGCSVGEVPDGLAALEQLRSSQFDLVLMDCEMPELDGWAATRRIRAEVSATIPIIAATAYAGEADRRRCHEAGMDDFLTKPLDVNLFTSTVERWLGSTAEAPSTTPTRDPSRPANEVADGHHGVAP